MGIQVIIPAAGSGQRMKQGMPKVFLPILKQPLISYTLKAFEKCDAVDSIILVGPLEHIARLEEIVNQTGITKVSAVVVGGKTRSESVRNGLAVLNSDTEIVLIHDGARPVVSQEIIEKGIARAKECGAAVAAVRIKPTLKIVANEQLKVKQTLDRDVVWEIQTPQVFSREILEKAYLSGHEATDDSALVERLGEDVFLYEAEYTNIKVTTPEDLAIAETLLMMRV